MGNICSYLWDMKQTHTPHQIEQLYKTIEQLQKELKAKHRQFVEQRAEADYYEMLYKTSQA